MELAQLQKHALATQDINQIHNHHPASQFAANHAQTANVQHQMNAHATQDTSLYHKIDTIANQNVQNLANSENALLQKSAVVIKVITYVQMISTYVFLCVRNPASMERALRRTCALVKQVLRRSVAKRVIYVGQFATPVVLMENVLSRMSVNVTKDLNLRRSNTCASPCVTQDVYMESVMMESVFVKMDGWEMIVVNHFLILLVMLTSLSYDCYINQM